MPQGSLDGADVSVLVGIYILSNLIKLVHIDNHGLYSAGALMTVSASKRANESIRKKALLSI